MPHTCFAAGRLSHITARIMVMGALGSPLTARGADCNSSTGPDIVVTWLGELKKWGTVDGVTGYSIAGLACNIGDENANWYGETGDHPVLVQNLYRLKNGKFEQIGMSWAKHGYSAFNEPECCPTCNDPGTTQLLGVGCSDVYGSNLNGNQAGTGTKGGLGPRSEVNPYTGELVWPYTTQGQAGDAIYKRMQVRNSDLAPAGNPDALYFAEMLYVSADDAAAGNGSNNASHIEVAVGEFTGGGWSLLNGDITNEAPAIYAWQFYDSDVTITTIDVPNDGRLILACKASDNGNGTWRYEYALYNLNCHRSVGSFSIPVPPGSDVSNEGFNDVDYHSGEPYSGTAWDTSISGGKLHWKTESYQSNHDANALRWGTLYNFRFDIDSPPASVPATVGLFRPGSPDALSIDVVGPDAGPIGDACEEAVPVQLGATTFSNADSEMDDPQLPCADSIGHVKWYKYTSTFDGRLRISTCNSADFNTVLGVYKGCGCETFNLIACSGNASGCGGGAKIEIDVIAGQCYLIQVAGSGSSSGSGTLKLSCADSSNAARADHFLTGHDPGGQFGFAVAGAGKFNGSGLDGAIIGAHLDDEAGWAAGRARVHQNPTLEQVLDFGGSWGEYFGQSVGGGGDLDGDGQDDLIIGAPENSEAGSKAGKIYVYSGADHALLWSKWGESAGDRFGWAVAVAGDVNRDGYDDVIVGAPLNDAGGTNAGRAYIYSGADGALIHKISGRDGGDRFGWAVGRIGDLDDDGADDVAIGAPYCDEAGSNSGRVTIYSGDDRKMIQKIDGSDSGDLFGSSLASMRYGGGGSARTLLIVGAPYNDANGNNSGQARVYMRDHGDPECGDRMCHRFTFNGQKRSDKFGTAVAMGRLAGNSKPDFVVGAPHADFNGSASGAFYIFDGANGSLKRRIVGEAAGDWLGWSVAMPGDLNGDGGHDLIAGAPRNDAGGGNAGRAYVFLSSSSSTAFLVADPDNHPVIGEDPTVGDIDGDGLVNAADLHAVLAAWGPCAADGPCSADIVPATGDGAVNTDDLLAVIAAWSDG